MEPLYRRQSFFSTQQNLRGRKLELEKLLRERLQASDVSDTLFEYLAVRREQVRDKLGKEGGEREKGEAVTLGELLELFKPQGADSA